MPDPKAAGVGPSAEAYCRRGAGVPQWHHCLMVIAPPAGCLKTYIKCVDSQDLFLNSREIIEFV